MPWAHAVIFPHSWKKRTDKSLYMSNWERQYKYHSIAPVFLDMSTGKKKIVRLLDNKRTPPARNLYIHLAFPIFVAFISSGILQRNPPSPKNGTQHQRLHPHRGRLFIYTSTPSQRRELQRAKSQDCQPPECCHDSSRLRDEPQGHYPSKSPGHDHASLADTLDQRPFGYQAHKCRVQLKK